MTHESEGVAVFTRDSARGRSARFRETATLQQPKTLAGLLVNPLPLLTCLLAIAVGVGVGGMIPVSTLMENTAYGASAPTKSAGCTDLRSLQPLAPLTLPAGHTHADISSAIKEVFADAGLAKKASSELRNVEQHPPNVVAEHEAAARAKAASAASSETTLATQALDLAATPKSATLVVSGSRDALAGAGDIAAVNTYVTVLTGCESLACT